MPENLDNGGERSRGDGASPQELFARFNALVERMNADGARMLEAMRPAIEGVKAAIANAARAISAVDPLCLPTHTDGCLCWSGDLGTARRCFPSYGRHGREHP